MATGTPLRSYVLQMADVQQAVARQFGYDIRYGPVEERVVTLVVDLTIGTVVKLLVDAGVITNTQLAAALAAVKAAPYGQQPLWVQPPADGTDPPAPTGF